MRKMIGPGGTGGCSKMNCLKKAVVEQVYAVAHPGRDVYDVVYWWCSEHNHVLNPDVYPNFELKEKKDA